MADEKDEKTTPAEAEPQGGFPSVRYLLMLLFAVGVALAIRSMAEPQDLSEIQGYKPESRALLRRDIKIMLQKALDRSYPVSLTEGEINQWLLGVLQAKQGGSFADRVSLEGVWVRLEEGRAEVVLERKVMGQPFTVSMYVRIDQTEGENGTKTEVHFDGGPYNEYLPFPKLGGRFGELPVPQGFLLLVMPAFKNLATMFPDEIRLGFEEMTRVKIEKGRLTLDPRVPAKTVASSP